MCLFTYNNIHVCVYMYVFSYSRGKFTTNLSAYWRIRQNTTSSRQVVMILIR